MSRPAEGLISVQKYIFYFLFMLRFPSMTDKTPRILVFLWECLSWFSVCLPLHMTICISYTVFGRLGLDDLLTLTTIGMEGAWFFFSFLGMVYYKWTMKDLVQLIDEIEATFKWRSPRGQTYVDMEKVHKYARLISIIWQLAPTSSVIFSIVLPLLETPIRLPVPSWYFVDIDNSFGFLLAFILQSWSKMVMVSSFASGSAFYISFSILCCGQFNILRCGLKNLIYTSGIYRRFPEVEKQPSAAGEYPFADEIEENLPPAKSLQQSTDYNLSPEEIKSFRVALKSCIHHHLDIVRICTMVEEFLNIFAFLRVAEMTLQICILAFLYAKTSKIIHFLFINLTFVDLFLLTYPAEHIRWQSSCVGPSLMMGAWHLVGKYFRSEFTIILGYSLRPINFTAGKIMNLNTDRFRQVITTAFSYYTLLSSFDTK